MGKPKGNRRLNDIKTVLEDAVRNILLSTPEPKRVETLTSITRLMTKMTNDLRVKALIEEEGADRIAMVRKEIESAREEFENCYYDNPGDAIEELWDSYGEYGQLCEALSYLESIEAHEAENE